MQPQSKTRAQPEMLLRLPEVKARVGISRAAIYAKMAKREFPPSVRLGPNSVAWTASSIEAFIADLVKKSQPGRGHGAA